MDKLIYTAMSGAKQSMQAQAIYANNLANVDTPGFKADYADAASVYLQGGAYNSIALVDLNQSGSRLDPGSMITTDRELDVAVQGEGWFSVLDQSGHETYTRAGNFLVDDSGALRTQSGRPVIGNSGAITLPEYEKIEFGSDGSISIRPLGSAPNTLVQVDQLKLVNPEEKSLVKGDDGLFRIKSGGLATADAGVSMVSGVLEGSNVNAVDSLLSIMNLSRQFELQMKEMKQASDLDESSNQLLKIKG